MKSSILDSDKLKEFVKLHKIQPFRIKQIYQEIFKNQNINFDDMTTLSKDLRELLKENFEIISLEKDTIIEDTQTTKIGFTVDNNKTIEAVIIYHKGKQDDEQNKGKGERITLCISSQVGCALACDFCVTGKLGFKKNLSWQEIISQVLYANNYIKNKFGKKEDGTRYGVRNIVFMGMGEPLLNYDNVIKAIEMMLGQEVGLGLSKRHVTISTAGIVPGIQQLIKDKIDVKLAISLHAPNQELRHKLMPIATKYSLEELMEAIDDYVKATNNRIFYEYIMIKNMTDKPELALQLSKLLHGRLAHVNLIPYNPNPATSFEESEKKTIREFQKILEDNGVTTTVRDTMGRKAKGACGQLGYEKIKAKSEEVLPAC